MGLGWWFGNGGQVFLCHTVFFWDGGAGRNLASLFFKENKSVIKKAL